MPGTCARGLAAETEHQCTWAAAAGAAIVHGMVHAEEEAEEARGPQEAAGGWEGTAKSTRSWDERKAASAGFAQLTWMS